MKRIAKTLLCGALVLGTGVTAVGSAPPAHAAAATVGNGLTTVDLNGVGMSPSSLAAALVGTGVSVSNVVYTGNNAQAGTIHLVDPAVVSFNDGVIMSSGNIADVIGPNKSESTTTDMAGPGDPTLDALIQNTQTVNPATYDAATLSFDFVPTANHVYFTYTFGSDEYLEWVNLYNDVFGFFVNGQNCATTQSGAPVSIDTINSNVNPGEYRDNSFANPPANPINIEPDGLTVEMICSAAVNAGQVNHMKLAIADTSDRILDSTVMIKAGSLSTVPPESCNNGTDDNGDNNIDMNDPLCQATTTSPPTGGSGIGSGNTAPPFTGNEGTPIPLDASALNMTATPDTVNTTWTVTGINGTPGSCTVSPPSPQPVGPGGAIAVVDAICPNEGEYVAHVWGWDFENKSSFDTDVDFFVHNAPPAVTIDAPINGDQAFVATPVAMSATVTDPGVNDTATCTIDWGDGTTEAGTLTGGSCTGTHSYTTPGQILIAVTATDNAGDTGAAATLLNATPLIVDVAPSITSQPVSVSLLGGQPYSFNASADGTPAPTVQWQQSVNGGSTWTDVAGATSPTLSGIATVAMNATQYHAVFTNAVGTAASTSATLSVAQTIAIVGSSSGTPVTGEAVTLTASIVDATKPSSALKGKATFFDGATVLGTKAVAAGSAAFKTTKLGLGAHLISVTYAATPTSTPIVSEAIAVTVGQPATHVVLSATPLNTTATKTVTLRAKVTVVLPGKGKAVPGSVTFYDGATPITTVTLTATTAVLKVTLPAGLHAITAQYNGSPSLLSSPLSNTVTVTTT